jgi:ParB family chromosome partitioning protein
VAAKVGKSLSYVYQRLKLADLVPTVKEAFLEDRITAGHAILIARLQPKYQEEVLGECFDSEYVGHGRREKVLIGVRALAGWIAENVHLDLYTAPWKKDDATLVPKAGACTTCPKRTGFAPELFPDIAKKDTCTDRACFGEKQDAFLTLAKADLKGKGTAFVEVSREYTGRRGAGGSLDPGRWEQVKPKSCSHVQAGLVVGGTGRGQILTVCAEPKCKVHGRGMMGPVTSPQERGRQKKAMQRQRQEAAFRGRLLDAVLAKVPPALGAPELGLIASQYLQEVWHENRTRVMRRHGWIPEKGRAAGSQDHLRVAQKTLGEMAPAELARLLVELSLVRALDVDAYVHEGKKNLFDLAKRYKVNVNALRREPKASKPGQWKKK